MQMNISIFFQWQKIPDVLRATQKITAHNPKSRRQTPFPDHNKGKFRVVHFNQYSLSFAMRKLSNIIRNSLLAIVNSYQEIHFQRELPVNDTSKSP